MLKTLRDEIKDLGPEHQAEKGKLIAGSAVSVSSVAGGAVAEFFDLAGDMVLEFSSLGIVGVIGFALFKFFSLEIGEM